MFGNVVSQIGIGVALLLGLACLFEAGYRLGRRGAKKREAPSGNQLGAIQGAILGLLALLLGLTFAGAASRFLERQDLIAQEANAVGTAFLRADLLDERHAAQVRQILAQYVRHRLEASKRIAATGLSPETAAQISEFHARLWSAARDGVLARPDTTRVVLDPINEIIDLHSLRIAAVHKCLPWLVVGLLIGCSHIAMAAIGYGCGLSGRRCVPMSGSLAILIAVALWTTIDLDHPRAGLIKLSDAPLAELTFPGVP